MEGKEFWKSKLFWLGIIQTLIAVLGLIADWLEAGNYTEPSVIMLVSGILTIVLRIWFTDSPVTH